MARMIVLLVGCAFAVWVGVTAATAVKASLSKVTVAIEQAGG